MSSSPPPQVYKSPPNPFNPLNSDEEEELKEKCKRNVIMKYGTSTRSKSQATADFLNIAREIPREVDFSFRTITPFGAISRDGSSSRFKIEFGSIYQKRLFTNQYRDVRNSKGKQAYTLDFDLTFSQRRSRAYIYAEFRKFCDAKSITILGAPKQGEFKLVFQITNPLIVGEGNE